MAKTFRINELGLRNQLTANASLPHFWEHWFETQAQRPIAERNLDEHRVWEDAVSFEILSLKSAKQ
jgi:hypothetical protein